MHTVAAFVLKRLATKFNIQISVMLLQQAGK
jgi:hypothetical protein